MFSKKNSESVDVLQKIRDEIVKNNKTDEKAIGDDSSDVNKLLSGEEEDFLSDIDSYFDNNGSFSSKNDSSDVNVVEKNYKDNKDNNTIIDELNGDDKKSFDDINKMVSENIDRVMRDQESFEDSLVESDLNDDDEEDDDVTENDENETDSDDNNVDDSSFLSDFDTNEYGNNSAGSYTNADNVSEEKKEQLVSSNKNQDSDFELENSFDAVENNDIENHNDSNENSGNIENSDNKLEGDDFSNNEYNEYNEDNVFNDFEIGGNSEYNEDNDSASSHDEVKNQANVNEKKNNSTASIVANETISSSASNGSNNKNSISNKTKSGVKGSITELIESVKNQMLLKKADNDLRVSGGSRTLDQFVSDLIQPKIVEFLNDNLERIVKEVVDKEIQKIVDDISDDG